MNVLQFWKQFFMFGFMLSMADEGGGDDSSDDDDGEDGDDGGQSLKAAIDAAVTKATSGLKAKNAALLGEKKTVSDKLAAFGDVDPEKIKAMMEHFDNDEEAKLIADNKWDEVIERRMKTERVQFGTEITTLTDNNKNLTEENLLLKTAHHNNLINVELRRAAERSEVLSGAIDDVLTRGRSVFTVDDDGAIVAMDKDGSPLLSKDGKDILSPEVFIEELKKIVPHYWGESVGSGQRPAKKVGASSDLLSKMEKAAEAGDMDLYRQLRNQRNKQMAG